MPSRVELRPLTSSGDPSLDSPSALGGFSGASRGLSNPLDIDPAGDLVITINGLRGEEAPVGSLCVATKALDGEFRHQHQVQLDLDGSGQTTEDLEHSHRVVLGQVQTAASAEMPAHAHRLDCV